MVLSGKHEYDSFAETNENKHLIGDGLAASEAEKQEFIASKSKRSFGVGLLGSLVLVMIYAAGSSKETARINPNLMIDESEAVYVLIPASEKKTECPQDTGVSHEECFKAGLSLSGKGTHLGNPLINYAYVGDWPWSPCGCTTELNTRHVHDHRDGYWTAYKSKGGTACTNNNPQGGYYGLICKRPKYVLIPASEEKAECPQDTGVSQEECFEAGLSLSGKDTYLGNPLTNDANVGDWPWSPCGCSTYVNSEYVHDQRDGYWTYYKSKGGTACTNNHQPAIYDLICKSASSAPISLPPIEATIEAKSSKGFCVSSKGVDQNNGVIKIGSKDFGPGIDLQTSCFKLCVEYSKESDDVMTGCEAIFNQANRGCYFHTDVVEKANGVKNHACWIV